jgi:flagellar motor switch protein FliG
MGVYTRYKKASGGFRQLVELLEATPKSKLEKMIAVGMQEDQEYTLMALSFMMTWDDVLKLPEMELAEVIQSSPPQFVGVAIQRLDKPMQDLFIRCAKPAQGGEIRDGLAVEAQVKEINGARAKLMQVARELERKGYVKSKKIPDNV